VTLLASPCCKADLDAGRCTACSLSYAAHEGIPVLLDGATSPGRWDLKYRSDPEPWDYSKRAVEVFRHRFLEQTTAELVGPDRSTRIGEVGCSLGLFSARLVTLSDHVAALDVSPTAVAKARAHAGDRLEIAAASATALPFKPGSMDLLILADGIVSWGLDTEQRRVAVAEAHRALKPEGRALFMEYLNPRAHQELLDPVTERFTVERVSYLNDRLWFITESIFRAFKGTALYDAFARNEPWARFLAAVSKAFGPRGSKHLCVVARK
jgi:SAM-dependent methyltransferase